MTTWKCGGTYGCGARGNLEKHTYCWSCHRSDTRHLLEYGGKGKDLGKWENGPPKNKGGKGGAKGKGKGKNADLPPKGRDSSEDGDEADPASAAIELKIKELESSLQGIRKIPELTRSSELLAAEKLIKTDLDRARSARAAALPPNIQVERARVRMDRATEAAAEAKRGLEEKRQQLKELQEHITKAEKSVAEKLLAQQNAEQEYSETAAKYRDMPAVRLASASKQGVDDFGAFRSKFAGSSEIMGLLTAMEAAVDRFTRANQFEGEEFGEASTERSTPAGEDSAMSDLTSGSKRSWDTSEAQEAAGEAFSSLGLDENATQKLKDEFFKKLRRTNVDVGDRPPPSAMGGAVAGGIDAEGMACCS